MSSGTVERTLPAANSVIPRLAAPVLGMVGEKASSAGESICFAVPPVRDDAKQELIPGGQERDDESGGDGWRCERNDEMPQRARRISYEGSWLLDLCTLHSRREGWVRTDCREGVRLESNCGAENARESASVVRDGACDSALSQQRKSYML